MKIRRQTASIVLTCFAAGITVLAGPVLAESAAIDTESINGACSRKQALELLERKQFSEAEAIFTRLLAVSPGADSEMDLAASHFRRGDYQGAYALVIAAMDGAVESRSGKVPVIAGAAACEHYTPAMMYLCAAECLYKQKLYHRASPLYRKALNVLEPGDWSLVAGFALAGLAACEEKLGNFSKAASHYEEMARLYRDLYGAEDINYGWALLMLSETLEDAGDDKRAEAAYEKSIWIFRQTNFLRLSIEYPDVDPDTLRKKVFGKGYTETFRNADSIFAGKSEFLAKTTATIPDELCPWRSQLSKSEAPGWVWLDPLVPTRAVLVCVHGLGLHHRAFDSFARRVAPEGIVTISFDVRGFGSYLESRGQDSLDLEECVEDLEKVIGCIKRDYAPAPLFLLGESMGGAIALRVASRTPENIDGLICSVPSGSRYKGARTAVKVGLRYLMGKNKPMNIGKQVIKQATSDDGLREQWSSDPSSRMMLTPKELLTFNSFMDQNLEVARRIDKTPVIFFQGDDDRLVKKEGTFDLFEALATPEKTMVLLGSTEHLIFEADQFKDDVTLGVIGWMRAHGAVDNPE